MALGLGLAVAAAQAAPASYPQRPVRLVVPFTPGGSADMVARVLADAMQVPLGQAVEVDNRAGTGGLIGAEAVARAPADGYTIGLGTISTLATNPVMLPKASRIEPARDFVPIIALASLPSVFSVPPSLGVRSFGQFVALARSRPDQLNIGSSGIGSIGHLLVLRMNAVFKIQLHHIPYKGLGPVLSSVLSGETQVIGDQFPSSAAHVAAGRLIPFAVGAQERLPALPQVPTLKELGYEGLNNLAITWFGLIAPKGTPVSVVQTLNAAANAALDDPAVRRKLQAMGVHILGGAPQRLNEMIEDSTRTVREIVQEQRIQVPVDR
ncbi:hypothetical protein GCM10010975_19360 [Comamonas phosphati]|nr:hypothetical protein GCM10010975_19360 [Comamonas phosphati]